MPARQHRVTRGDDYRRIVRSGYRVGGALCIAHAVLHSPESSLAQSSSPESSPSETVVHDPSHTSPARFGFIISKAVGGAVVRNRVRRRLKYIVEQRLHEGFHGMDVVFRALPAIAAADFSEIDREVNRQLDRIDSRLRGASGSVADGRHRAPSENPGR